jgi:AcrR family transcriptional regulator
LWHHAHPPRRLPRPAQFRRDKERSVAPGEDTRRRRLVVRDHVERRQFSRIPTAARHDGLTNGALKRGKAEDATMVVPEQELEEPVAEPADAIVQDQVASLGARRWLLARLNHVLILMNMFTENVKPRGRGRPPGQSPQGVAARDRLYATAIRMIRERGYEATTLREIAKEAGVSVGLLYRYFPSKQAVIIALYDELSQEFAGQTAAMKDGRWRDRFLFALATSLRVLQPHRTTLRALIPILVGDPDDGVFASSTAFSRLRVQQVFEDAVTRAADAPKPPLAAALGRLLYLVHLAVLLWWLLDKTPKQRATEALIGLTEQLLPSSALALRLPPIRRFVVAIDELIREGLFGSPAPA